jgi:ABC-2 type transport system permease protein
MDKLVLKFVLFIAKFFLKDEVDFDQLKMITETKLIMDRRRVRISINNRKLDEDTNQMNWQLGVSCFMGLLVSVAIFFFSDIVVSMSVIHTYILFMMSMMLITDFSSVILDTTDNQIILPRPVSSKTFYVSRLVHILVYLLQFSIALSIFTLLFAFIKYGFMVGLCCIFTILLTVLLSVFITYFFYGMILKFSSEQKLKEIIGNFQIVMTIIFVGGSQIIPRLFSSIEIEPLVMSIEWYTYLLPPMWMAFLLKAVQEVSTNFQQIILIVFAIFIPLISFWALIKYLAPTYSANLSRVGNASEEVSNSSNQQIDKRNSTLSEKCSAFFCNNDTEKAGFDLTWKITSRDKDFRVQFYPSFVYIGIMAFVFIFNRSRHGINWEEIKEGNSFLWLIYLPILGLFTAAELITYNEHFAASWIYYSRPLTSPGSIISGALKSLLIKFMFPIMCILFMIAYFFWGNKIVDDFILGICNNILCFFLVVSLGTSYLPFSVQPSLREQAGRFFKSIKQMFFISILVGLHYLSLSIWWLVLLLIPLSALSSYFLMRKIRNYTWEKIED